MSKYADLAGRTVHGQFVLGLVRRGKHGYIHAEVQCSCGARHFVQPITLLRGRARRCLTCARKNQTGSANRGWRGGRHVSLTVFNKFKRSAERRRIEWALSIADIDFQFELQGGKCALSGEPLVFDHGNRDHEKNGNASLDRIDSRMGYVPRNIQLTTKIVNISKQTLSNIVFIEMCLSVASNAEVRQ